MKNNVIQEKSFAFAVRIVNLTKYLQREHKEYTLAEQIMRSGTSIGANVEEAIGGQSQKDFLSKISIAYKEARETAYWLKLLFHTEYLSETMYHSLQSDLEEIQKILASIQLTTKTKLRIKN